MGGSDSKPKKKEGGYPSQGGYPTQASQPQQKSGPPPQQPPYPGQTQPPPYGAPHTQPYGAPPVQQYGGQVPYGHPQTHYQNGVQYAPVQNQFHPGQTVVVPGGFDNGARFTNGQANIPPPPPGCLPNAAQVASAQGATVQVSQDKRSKLEGDMGGGVTFW